MLKLGVFKAEDHRLLRDRKLRRKRSLFSERISLQLLHTGTAPSEEEIATFEQVMRELRLTSGVYRTTFRDRFRELDRILNALAADRYPRDASLEIHDWAASDCLTSSEWAASIFAIFPDATVVASDLTLFLIEITLPDGDAFVIEPGGGGLQYLRKPFVVRLSPPEPKVLIVNYFLWRIASARLAELQKSLDLPRSWLESDEEAIRIPPLTLRKIAMIHPEARALAAHDRRFSIRRHSAFDALERPVDIVRTMNIYNRVYFGEQRLEEGARAVWRSLKPGGWWIVGRTPENTLMHNASVLEKRDSGFAVVTRLGDGSEIEDLALNLRAPS
jgi:hypothetical protein